MPGSGLLLTIPVVIELNGHDPYSTHEHGQKDIGQPGPKKQEAQQPQDEYQAKQANNDVLYHGKLLTF